MQVTTETIAVSVAPVICLKGRGKAARELAYMQIAPLAMIETQSRDDSIANLRKALGTSPSIAEVKTAQIEWIIGRVAAKLPAGEFPKAAKDDDKRLQFARDVVTRYAGPVEPGKTAPKLRKGQTGRRSPMQHKVTRAAESAWSLIKAELGFGTGQTLKEKDAKQSAKRSTNANPVRGAGKSAGKAQDAKPTAPTHSELVQAPKPVTADDACQHISTQAATLLAYCNKNASIVPADFGKAVNAFKSAINKALNERALATAQADAEK